MATTKEIIQILEEWAKPHRAESWDNVGYMIGHPAAEVSGILLALDFTRDVLQEASALGANLVLTHHPVIFQPLKSLGSDNPLGLLLADAIRHNLTVYAAHTNLDVSEDGVSAAFAAALGLKNPRVLVSIRHEQLYKIVVFVPEEHADGVREALSKTGAGWIGNYSHCTFQAPGTGTFLPKPGAQPFIGIVGKLERVAEVRLETIVPADNLYRAVQAMLAAHPYEEPAYDIYPLANSYPALGYGQVGDVVPCSLAAFAEMVKKVLSVSHVRVIGDLQKTINRVACLGGSGKDFIRDAAKAGADVYVTGDIGYHDAMQALELGLALIDAGHYHTEWVILPVIKEKLTAQFADRIPIYISQTQKCPFTLV